MVHIFFMSTCTKDKKKEVSFWDWIYTSAYHKNNIFCLRRKKNPFITPHISSINYLQIQNISIFSYFFLLCFLTVFLYKITLSILLQMARPISGTVTPSPHCEANDLLLYDPGARAKYGTVRHQLPSFSNGYLAVWSSCERCSARLTSRLLCSSRRDRLSSWTIAIQYTLQSIILAKDNESFN